MNAMAPVRDGAIPSRARTQGQRPTTLDAHLARDSVRTPSAKIAGGRRRTGRASVSAGRSDEAARQALSRLAAKGEIASPARGFYVIVPPEYRRLGCLPADQFIPALMEHRKVRYYVGLLSAAQYHGAAHHRPQAVQVVLGRNRPAISCGSVKVSFVARGNVGEVPVRTFNTPRGTILVSTVEATAVDLVGYMHRAGGLDQVAGLLTELGGDMDPNGLVDASKSASILWAQRLGYLLEHVGAADKAVLLKEHVRKNGRNFTKLLPAANADNAPRSKDWRLYVNANVEADA